MKLVSFYCDVDFNTFYYDSSVRLKQQCENVGMEYHIVEKKFGNDWIDNVRAKPKFLIEMIGQLNEDFIWLDVDCNLLKKIDFEIKSDWGVDFKSNGLPHDYVHYVKNNINTKDFLYSWINQIENSKKGSHTAFISIYKSINVDKIPKGYTSLVLSETKSKKKYLNEK